MPQDLALDTRTLEQAVDPDSILDFSCLDDLFDFRSFDILFDPGRSMADLLGLVQRRICSAARKAYRGYVGRPLDAAPYTARTPRLPGLDPSTAYPYWPGAGLSLISAVRRRMRVHTRLPLRSAHVSDGAT